MKRMFNLAALCLTALLALTPALSLAEATPTVAPESQTYTLEQMLTFAMQDEYNAQATYDAILNAFGENNAFTNIVKAEVTHQEELRTLFQNYGIAMPENTAAQNVTAPVSLQEAFAAGVDAENANIAMYQAFLAQKDLPDDVRGVFNTLVNASQNHLTAFTRNAEKNGLGLGQGNGQGMGNGQGSGNGQTDTDTDSTGNGNGRGRSRSNMQTNGSSQANADCPDCTIATGTQSGRNSRR